MPGTYWVEARDTAGYPISYRTAPHKKELFGPK